MSWHELLGQVILIRLPDDEVGFVYVVKYGGVTVRRGFVPAMAEDYGKPVPGELIKSCGDWSLVQPSTVSPPLVGIESYWRCGSVNTRFWQASFQPSMRSMAIIVMLEIE